MSTPRPAPIFIDAAPGEVAAVMHAPAATMRRDVSVLICPPWGWDEAASARSRRVLAGELAAAGLPTLRIDLPGTGDSDGTPRDPALVSSWIRAISRSAAWLQALEGTRQVAVIGLGLGGLLARAAIAHGAPVDELVLWGVPRDGREFLRRMRAFSRLAGLPPDEDLEEGAITAGGYLLSAATVEAIAALSPAESARGRLQRALVLDAPSARGSAADGLESRGVRVQGVATDGWAALTSHPEQSVLDPEALSRMRQWLLAGTERTGAAMSFAALRTATLSGGIRECAFEVPAPQGALAGVLTQPRFGDAEICAVFLSSGALGHGGPNRMWVEASRRLAEHGIPCARVDLASVGESDARRPEQPWKEAEFYECDGEAQVAAVLDQLERLGAGSRFALIGLCSGGYWGFRSAMDPRVAQLVLINAGAFVWDRQATSRAELRRVARLRDPEWWGKLARGEVDLRAGRFRRAGAALLHGGASEPAGHGEAIAAAFDRVSAQGKRTCIAFSGNEIAHGELERLGLLDDPARWPGVSFETLPGTDHTLRPLGAQATVQRLIDRELAALTVPG